MDSFNKKSISGGQSLMRGLHLLEILSNFPNGCPLAHISEISKLNKSTTHRLLQSLQLAGYVKPSLNPGSYRLTTKCLSLGQKTLTSLNIINISIPYLESLNLNLGETVNLSMAEKDHVVLIYKLDPTGGLMRTKAYIGQRMELYCSAMGKIFMAYSDETYCNEYFKNNNFLIKKLTNTTIVDIDKMKKELKIIKENMYAVDNEENEIGVSCIACPIFDFNGKTNYSVSVSASTFRLNQIGIDKVLKEIKDTALNISKELGGKF